MSAHATFRSYATSGGHPGHVQRSCGCAARRGAGRPCNRCAGHKPAGRDGGRAPCGPAAISDVLQSAGEPLDKVARSYFEPLFGSDFSRVRIHATDKGAQSARSISALAYTVGQHIVFDAGQYEPSGTAGRRLLAHELTHVVQQGSGQPSLHRLSVGDPGDVFEQQAERVAGLIAHHGKRVTTSAMRKATALRGTPGASVIQRQVPTGIALKDVKSFGHSQLAAEEDKEKYSTYIGAVALMQLTPQGDYTAGQQKGDCTKEFITEVANTCPASTKPFCEGDRCFEVGKTDPLGDALTHQTFSGGPDSFVDFHRDRQRTNFLAGSGKKQCSVACHQVYKYRTEPDHKYHELGAFYIIRNFQGSKFTPTGSKTSVDITTGNIQKVSAPSTAPSKDDFANKVAPGLVTGGVLLDAPPVAKSTASPQGTAAPQTKDEKK